MCYAEKACHRSSDLLVVSLLIGVNLKITFPDRKIQLNMIYVSHSEIFCANLKLLDIESVLLTAQYGN